MKEFPFVVGDKLVWGSKGYLEITAIGEYRFLAKTFSPFQSVYEDSFRKPENWKRYSAPPEDEQHQGDDRKDDEDRPQHVEGDTPLCDIICGLCVCNLKAGHGGMHICFCEAEWVQFGDSLSPRPEQLRRIPPEIHYEHMMWTPPKPVTPEIQAVLDALPAWARRFQSEFPGSPHMHESVADLWYAVQAYLASTKPPEPETVYPERWVVVWPKGVGYANRAEALDAVKRLGDTPEYDALGILHLHPDGTTTMEQP